MEIHAYREWSSALTPRSCIVVNWLADLGAVPEPGEEVRARALRFAQRFNLIESWACYRDTSLNGKAQLMIENGDLPAFVAWFLWMHFVDTVPRRFVLPGGRDRVIGWVKGQLNRPELTPQETLRELYWRADLMRRDSGEEDVFALLRN
jgi:hypothetical protein